MSTGHRHHEFLRSGEHDDVGATGLPGARRSAEDDPLSPTFGVPHEDPSIAPSPPSGFVALHPAAVEAARELKAGHDARIAVGLPGYIPDAEPTEPPTTSAPQFDRTQSRDSASSGNSRLAKPFLEVLQRVFNRE